jgi:uncharacterized delta-60 repeat protein
MFSAGSLDSSFGSGGKSLAAFDLGGGNTDWAQAMTVDKSGRTVVVGRARHADGNDDFAIARFRADGRLDSSFSGDGKVTIRFDLGGANKDEALAVAIDSKGRIVVGGYAQTAGQGDYDFAAARLLPNGRLDKSFDKDGTMTIHGFDPSARSDDRVSDISIDKKDRIILVGQVSKPSGTKDKDFGFARLTTAGRLDTSFGSGGLHRIDFAEGADDWAAAVAIDTGGRIVVAGTVWVGYNGRYDFGVVRLLATGVPDSSFSWQGKRTIHFDLGGDDDITADVALDKQGRILVAGTVDRRSDMDDRDMAVARLMADGRMDDSFGIEGKTVIPFDYGGTLEDRATGLQVDSLGRIVVAGIVTRDFSGNTDLAVARLTANGFLDTAFGSGSGRTTVAFDYGGSAPFRHAELSAGLAIDKKGRIIVAGTTKHFADADWDFVVATFRS